MLNLLEPEGLVRAFMAEPPERFSAFSLNAGDKQVYSFIAELDLFTTADDTIKKIYLTYKKFLPAVLKRLLRPTVLFIGTTVSEYALFQLESDSEAVAESSIAKLRETKLQFLIIKDLPFNSPLISAEENHFSSQLIQSLTSRGFLLLHGQALAYVPITFSSTQEYLQKLSRSRRKDIRRKLRSRDELSIEEIRTGSACLTDETITDLYRLYLNVYEDSDVHFDKLTLPFFTRVLKDGSSNGIVFIYRSKEKLIGFNLCFLHKDNLIDKYIGFLYPDSLEYNLYSVSWMYNLEFCIRNNLKTFIAGWTDPQIKAYLGADFTHTRHAVYIRNPLLRNFLRPFKSLFEADRKAVNRSTA